MATGLPRPIQCMAQNTPKWCGSIQKSRITTLQPSATVTLVFYTSLLATLVYAHFCSAEASYFQLSNYSVPTVGEASNDWPVRTRLATRACKRGMMCCCAHWNATIPTLRGQNNLAIWPARYRFSFHRNSCTAHCSESHTYSLWQIYLVGKYKL